VPVSLAIHPEAGVVWKQWTVQHPSQLIREGGRTKGGFTMRNRITTRVALFLMVLVLGIAPLYGGMRGGELTAHLTGVGGHQAEGTAMVTHEGNTFG